VRPIFAVTPPEARLGEFDPLSANRARLFVENFAEEPIELEGAETDVEGVRAGLQPLQAGRTWRIVVSVAPERKPGPFAGRIRIRTTSPHQPVIDVPLDGTVVKLKPPSP
jgi:hypothetical protein